MACKVIKKIVLFCMLNLLAKNIHGQKFYPDIIAQAYKEYDSSNYKLASVLFSKAFKKKRNPNLFDLYSYACCKNLLGNKKKSLNVLFKIAKRGYSNTSLTKDKRLESLRSNVKWKWIVEKIKGNRSDLESGYKKDLMQQLQSIYYLDQKHRRLLDSVWKNDYNNIPLKVSISDSISKYDSINLLTIENIISNFGWPGIDKVGELGNFTVFLIIQHSNLDKQERYLPLLLESIRKNQSPRNFKALLIDRILIKKGRKQIYGTQVQFNHLTKKNELLPVKKPHKIDKLRSKVDLVSSKSYLKELNGE